jgi:hypothetical protein
MDIIVTGRTRRHVTRDANAPLSGGSRGGANGIHYELAHHEGTQRHQIFRHAAGTDRPINRIRVGAHFDQSVSASVRLHAERVETRSELKLVEDSRVVVRASKQEALPHHHQLARARKMLVRYRIHERCHGKHNTQQSKHRYRFGLSYSDAPTCL